MASFSLFLFFEFGVIYLSYSMTPDVNGPDFLVYYFFLWFVLWAVAKLSRWKTVAPVIIYCSSGLARFIDGQEYSLSNFGILWFMMFGGTIVYLILAVDSFSSGGRSGGCGGGCGGGNGGGGCGGGCGGD